MTRFLYPFPPPCHISPRAATFASLPLFTGIPSNSLLNSCCGFPAFQPRFTHTSQCPSGRTGPGNPIPAPEKSESSSPLSFAVLRIEAAISPRMYFPFSSFLVGTSHFFTRVPSSSKIPSFTLVPPISIPIHFKLMCVPLFLNLPDPFQTRFQIPRALKTVSVQPCGLPMWIAA